MPAADTSPSVLPEPAFALPDGVAAYKRTPDFNQTTVPAGLLRRHSTREGVWGIIRVLSGELLYWVEDERRARRTYRITPDVPGIVEPTILHRVQPQGPVHFHVEFFR
jgi:tellurite resistance-related uncharacterized protein